MALTDKLTNIANAIRAKTGGTATLTLDQMASDLNAISNRTSSDLTASGATVTVPAGNYKTQATKSVATATQATPSVSINSSGLITASATQTAGYVSAGTKSGTKQLTTQAAKTVTPSTSSQTAVASGVYTTGAVTVAAIPSSYVKPTATKDAATITPGTSNQTIAAGTYCSGAQTIAGDADLKAANIKKGVNIFGVAGSYEGAGLNFTVVGGTTEPTNPTVYTIWINTSNTITNWHFTSEEPTSPTEGLVWIYTGTKTEAKFDAVSSSDKVVVYPLRAKQYISGAWVYKVAKTYKSAGWVDWFTYIIENGVTNTDITSGWKFVNIYNGQNPGSSVTGGALKVSQTFSFGRYDWEIMTKTSIDLTDIETIELYCDATAKGSAYVDGDGWANMKFYCKSSSSASAAVSATIVSKGSVTGKTVKLNVANLTGKYYLSVYGTAYCDNGNVTVKMYNMTMV